MFSKVYSTLTENTDETPQHDVRRQARSCCTYAGSQKSSQWVSN